MKTAILSNKGQVILPTTALPTNQLITGAEFAAATLDEVVGCTGYVGKSYTVAEMHEVIATKTKPSVKLL